MQDLVVGRAVYMHAAWQALSSTAESNLYTDRVQTKRGDHIDRGEQQTKKRMKAPRSLLARLCSVILVAALIITNILAVHVQPAGAGKSKQLGSINSLHLTSCILPR